jgi:hypothetical protein
VADQEFNSIKAMQGLIKGNLTLLKEALRTLYKLQTLEAASNYRRWHLDPSMNKRLL